jgi:hypothetical protein
MNEYRAARHEQLVHYGLLGSAFIAMALLIGLSLVQ